MIDTGRRFTPVDLLHNLIDTMAAVKLNVLHMHLSDFCRCKFTSNTPPVACEFLADLDRLLVFYSRS